MNYGELKEALVRDVLQREDVTEHIPLAIRQAHLELQRTCNWRCMQHRIEDVEYSPDDKNGVVVAADYKSGRTVWLQGDNGALTLIKSSSEHRFISDQLLVQQRARLPEPATLAGNSWHERAQRLVLAVPPTDETIELTIDYWRWLPFYQDFSVGGEGEPETTNEASDWFSNYAHDVLLWAAAYRGAKFLFQDDRADHFLKTFAAFREEAHKADQESQQAGVARVYDPPLPSGCNSIFGN